VDPSSFPHRRMQIRGWIPACAGMTEGAGMMEGAGMTERGKNDRIPLSSSRMRGSICDLPSSSRTRGSIFLPGISPEQ
jgi:hypothetical protein